MTRIIIEIATREDHEMPSPDITAIVNAFIEHGDGTGSFGQTYAECEPWTREHIDEAIEDAAASTPFPVGSAKITEEAGA